MYNKYFRGVSIESCCRVEIYNWIKKISNIQILLPCYASERHKTGFREHILLNLNWIIQQYYVTRVCRQVQAYVQRYSRTIFTIFGDCSTTLYSVYLFVDKCDENSMPDNTDNELVNNSWRKYTNGTVIYNVNCYNWLSWLFVLVKVYSTLDNHYHCDHTSLACKITRVFVSQFKFFSTVIIDRIVYARINITKQKTES